MDSNTSNYVLGFISDCLANHSVHGVLSVAYRYLENPCLIADVSYNTVDIIGGENFSDPFWDDYAQDGHVSEESLLRYIENGLLSPQYDLLYPIFFPKLSQPEVPGCVRRLSIAVPSKEGEVHCGWIAVYEHNRAFNSTDMEIISWLAKILTRLLDAVYVNKTLPPGRIENMFVDILNGATTDFTVTAQRLKVQGWKTSMHNRVLTIQSNQGAPAYVVQKIIADMLGEFFERPVVFNYNQALVAVLCSEQDEFTKRLFITELNKILKKFNLFAAFSAELPDISYLKHHFSQAMNCLEVCHIKDLSGQAVFFDDYSIDTLMYMASRSIDLREFCHRYLFELQEIDMQQETDYLDSLKYFVFNNGNLKAASQDLDIHRNTLSNRIEKIMEYLNIDCISQKLLADLYFSFIIYEIIKPKWRSQDKQNRT